MSDPDINENTNDYAKETKKANWGGSRTLWYTRRGSLKAVCHNIRDALDKVYYEQLEDDLVGNKQVTIREYFQHLDAIWCKMDTKAVTKITALFYEPWDQVMHITKFAKQLDRQQAYLKTTGINITEESKLQFYTKQILDRAMFDKRNIIEWEDRTKDMKTWALATKYFEQLVTSEERYTSMVGGTAKKARFESAA